MKTLAQSLCFFLLLQWPWYPVFSEKKVSQQPVDLCSLAVSNLKNFAANFSSLDSYKLPKHWRQQEVVSYDFDKDGVDDKVVLAVRSDKYVSGSRFGGKYSQFFLMFLASNRGTPKIHISKGPGFSQDEHADLALDLALKQDVLNVSFRYTSYSGAGWCHNRGVQKWRFEKGRFRQIGRITVFSSRSSQLYETFVEKNLVTGQVRTGGFDQKDKMNPPLTIEQETKEAPETIYLEDTGACDVEPLDCGSRLEEPVYLR